MRLRAVVVLLVALAAFPGAALAAGSSTGGAGNALSPGLPASPNAVPSTPTAAPPVTTTGTGSSSSSSGLSGTNALVIVIGALVVITAISLFIWRDARRRAPVRATAGGPADPTRRSGSKQRGKPRKLSPAERRRRKRGRARR